MSIDRKHGLAISDLVEQLRQKFPMHSEAMGLIQNAVNDLYMEVDGLPLTPPGGLSGQLQANNGSGGLSAVTTSAGIAASISDETGSGALVFGTSPTIVTPTIASFVNATHNHQSAAGGGALDAAAVTTGAFAQEAWTNATFGGAGWVDGALSGDQVTSYRKDRNGGIWGRGVAKNGTTTDGTTIYTLGAGYRPTSPVRISVTVFDVTPAFIAAPAILRIGTDGTVQIYSAPAGTVYICLGFSFPNV